MTSSRTRSLKPARPWDQAASATVPADVLACLEELGIAVLHVSGDEAVAHCAQHLERTGKRDRHPSWSCNTESGIYNCFSCGWKGSFNRLVADILGLPWDQAQEWIRQRGGIEVARRILDRRKDAEQPETRPAIQPVTDADLALFTPPPAHACTAKGVMREAAGKYGVLWDPERELWITPIRAADGTLKGWQEKGRNHFKNVPFTVRKSHHLFGHHLLRPGKQAILVESPLDAVRMLSVGVSGAVSSYGAHVSEEQMHLLFAITGQTGRIIIALDNDRDGWNAAKILREKYPGMGKRLAFYAYRGNEKDPGEQSGSDIRFGVEHALSPLRMRFS